MAKLQRAVYSEYRQLDELGIVSQVLPPAEKQPLQNGETEQQALFRMIFELDPDTNLPSDDIGRMMSGSIDPDVAKFIKEQLMQDVSNASPLGMPVGIDEELALQLSRSDGESRSDYIRRLQNFMSDEKELIRLNQKAIEVRAKVESNSE